MSGSVLILGATSAIARGTAAAFAARGDNLYLASRDTEELKRIAADLQVRYGVKVYFGPFDASATDTHPEFFKNVIKEMHELSGVVLAFGMLGEVENAAKEMAVFANIQWQAVARGHFFD